MTSLNILKNKEVLFFIDTNKKKGFGHVQRCLRFSSVFSNFDKVLVGNKKIKLKNFKYLNFNNSSNKNFFKNYSVIELLKTIFFGIKNKNNYHISLFNFETKDIKNIYKLQTPENRKYFKENKTFSYKHHVKYLNKFNKVQSNFILTIKKNFFKTIGYTKFEEYKKKYL